MTVPASVLQGAVGGLHTGPLGGSRLMDRLLDAALRLHRFLLAAHWDGRALRGPDPGIRLNYRIGRFVKSYLPLAWRDSYYYVQAQGYWALGNWTLWSRTAESQYRNVAIACSDELLAHQRGDGAWEYPNPEWAGRIATTEGTWGAIGLTESYRHTGEERFLAGAQRWHRFVEETIGFQRMDGTLAVNYFAHRSRNRVPNNSAFYARYLAELADVTGDRDYLRPASGLLAFLRGVQAPTGELPYVVPSLNSTDDRPHFQCYQYNAFQCLDLLRYHQLTGDPAAIEIARRVLRFLVTGVGADGHVAYACGATHRAVTYHAAVVAAAFTEAARSGVPEYEPLAERAFAWLLAQQRGDGGFAHSRGDYSVLRDRRSYPRYLAMILVHLLAGAAAPRLHLVTEARR